MRKRSISSKTVISKETRIRVLKEGPVPMLKASLPGLGKQFNLFGLFGKLWQEKSDLNV